MSAIIRYETERPVDEIYVEHCRVHLERMSQSGWYLGIAQGEKEIKVKLDGFCADYGGEMQIIATVYDGLEYLVDDTSEVGE